MKIIHGSPGFGSKLNEEQISEFLSKKLNLQFGSLDIKGEPNIHPVWFYFHEGKFFVETSKTSVKVQNIKNNNIVYFCIDDETMPYKGVRGKGIAIIHEDVKHILPIAEKIMIKYTGNLENEIAKFLLDGVKNGISVILEINPKYFSTWDHSTGITK